MNHLRKVATGVAWTVLAAAAFGTTTAWAQVQDTAPNGSSRTTVGAPQDQGKARWLGPDGRYLPFSEDRQVLEFLATAAVIESQEINGTSSKPLKLTLEKDGVRAHAIFRTVDVEREHLRNSREHARGFRDYYGYEVAAYEVSRLLGIDSVPPATLRLLDGQEGSIQLWVEQAMGVQDRIDQGINPAHQQMWLYQKQNMAVFDNLIYNFDRNPGNILIDGQGKVWFVDHTRSFKILPFLSDRNEMHVCERKLYEGLRDLDVAELRERLDPYLRQTEIDALIKRRQKLLRLLNRKIAQMGEDAILFSFVRT